MTSRNGWLEEPRQALDEQQLQWLEPPGPWGDRCSAALYGCNWLLARAALRIRCQGVEHLPAEGPFLLTPNHSSSLDPVVLAAVLPFSVLRRTRWAAARGVVFRNAWTRLVNRIGRSMPVDRDLSALAAAAALLEQGQNLIWFPEGTRTRDGQLQPFHAGIGSLLLRFRVPAIPIGIAGAFEALPPQGTLPRLRARIQVAIGRPFRVEQLDQPDPDARAVAGALRERVRQLLNEAG